jgi:hypothetical protein
MQKGIFLVRAQARIRQGWPSSRFWADDLRDPSALMPEPQVEQAPLKFSLQTSQLIPQAPVGMFSPLISHPMRDDDRVMAH